MEKSQLKISIISIGGAGTEIINRIIDGLMLRTQFNCGLATSYIEPSRL